MIIKRARSRRDNKKGFRHLVRYMTRGSKIERLTWFGAGNLGPVNAIEHSELAIDLVEATQRWNTRAKGDRTYHLIVSFDPRDRALEERELGAIVQEILCCVGYQEHQYVAVRHSATEHEHLHLAVNKVHPETFRIHDPSFDKRRLYSLARELEDKYGLVPLKVRQRTQEQKLVRGARDFEAHHGRESFSRWARRVITSAIEQADPQDWQTLHGLLSRYGVRIVPRGNGLVIQDVQRTELRIKASFLGREFSKGRLCSRFGAYIPAPAVEQVLEVREARYDALPLQREDSLWREYRQTLDQARGERARSWMEYRRSAGRKRSHMILKFRAKHQMIQALPVSNADKRRLHRMVAMERSAAHKNLSRNLLKERERIKQTPHPGSWRDFLSKQMLAGDERAAALSGARNEAFGLRAHGKGHPAKLECPYVVTRKGSVVYFLSGGQRIIDAGQAVQTPPDASQDTIEQALRLAKEKFPDQPLEVTGPRRYQKRVLRIAAAQGLAVSTARAV